MNSSYVRSVVLKRDDIPTFTQYPFNLPSIRTLNQLTLDPNVTYLIGENGM
jgi:predicted ATPase